MPLYRVFLTGRNIVRVVDGRRELMGFTTDRVLEAGDPDHAGEYALEMLLEEDPALRNPENGPEDPFPVILVESVEEMDFGSAGTSDEADAGEVSL